VTQSTPRTRILLAQSCNGVGWIFGPVVGGMFFYSKNAAGASTGSQTLFIPYVAVAVVVIVIAVVFYFSNVPDIKAKDDYHLDDKEQRGGPRQVAERSFSRPLVYVLLWLNAAVLILASGMILWVVLSTIGVSDSTMTRMLWIGGVGLLAASAAILAPVAKNISHHSMWSQPHFSAAVLAQFFYVAAQAGIFSFFINYITTETPAIPGSWNTGWPQPLAGSHEGRDLSH